MQVGDIVRLKVVIDNRPRMKIKKLEIVPIEQLGNPDLQDMALCYWFDSKNVKQERWFNLSSLELTN
jgi:uncharacterized protein YodC (DUF2158 family)